MITKFVKFFEFNDMDGIHLPQTIFLSIKRIFYKYNNIGMWLPVGIWILDKVISHPVWDYTELEIHSGSGLLVQPQSWRLMGQRSHISHLGEIFWLICYFLLSCKCNIKIMALEFSLKKPSTFYHHLEHANFSHVPQLTLV